MARVIDWYGYMIRFQDVVSSQETMFLEDQLALLTQGNTSHQNMKFALPASFKQWLSGLPDDKAMAMGNWNTWKSTDVKCTAEVRSR